jgi:predicted membrane-bound spermidine synthase
LQHFVLLLGHPVYSLTVTLFSLLLGTGVGSLISRRIDPHRVQAMTSRALGGIALVALLAPFIVPRLIDIAIPWPLSLRILLAVAIMLPLGVLLGIPLPGGMRLLSTRRPDIIRGAGVERRVLGRRRDAGRLHRDELGLLDHADRSGGRLATAAGTLRTA